MDVEKTQKMNNLAKELVKQGLAPSSEHATKLAEEMISKDAPKSEVSESNEIAFERLQRKINYELEPLKQQVQSLTNQLNDLRNQVRNLRINQVQERPKQESQAKLVEEAPKEKAEEKPCCEPKEGDNQRTGEFKPGDVDINKVFYYGNK